MVKPVQKKLKQFAHYLLEVDLISATIDFYNAYTNCQFETWLLTIFYQFHPGSFNR